MRMHLLLVLFLPLLLTFQIRVADTPQQRTRVWKDQNATTQKCFSSSIHGVKEAMADKNHLLLHFLVPLPGVLCFYSPINRKFQDQFWGSDFRFRWDWFLFISRSGDGDFGERKENLKRPKNQIEEIEWERFKSLKRNDRRIVEERDPGTKSYVIELFVESRWCTSVLPYFWIVGWKCRCDRGYFYFVRYSPCLHVGETRLLTFSWFGKVQHFRPWSKVKFRFVSRSFPQAHFGSCSRKLKDLNALS